MVLQNSIKEENSILLTYCLKPDMELVWNASSYLIGELIHHEDGGSLYDILKKQGLIEKISADDDFRSIQIIHMFSIQVQLTD